MDVPMHGGLVLRKEGTEREKTKKSRKMKIAVVDV